MTDVTSFISLIQDVGFIGLLIILALPPLRKKVFGNGNGKEELLRYYNHDLTDKLRGQDRKLDKILEVLDDMRINGIRIKK